MRALKTGNEALLGVDAGRRYDFVMIYDVVMGNPNGDPDGDNCPRQDPETGHGFVTDSCVKRKVRDYLEQYHGLPMYISRGRYLAEQQREVYESLGITAGDKVSTAARDRMCEQKWDVRAFGAVMSTGKASETTENEGGDEAAEITEAPAAPKAKKPKKAAAKLYNCGQVRGPLQLGFSTSVSPVSPVQVAVSRVSHTSEEQGGRDTGTFGSKWVIPYGLFVMHGSFSPEQALRSGFESSDLELFFEALEWCWANDAAAARAEQNFRGLYIFEHESPRGDAHPHILRERIQVRLKEGVLTPRSFDDYEVRVDEANLPARVSMIILDPKEDAAVKAAA